MSNGGNGGGEFVGDTSGAGYWAYQGAASTYNVAMRRNQPARMPPTPSQPYQIPQSTATQTPTYAQILRSASPVQASTRGHREMHRNVEGVSLHGQPMLNRPAMSLQLPPQSIGPRIDLSNPPQYQFRPSQGPSYAEVVAGGSKNTSTTHQSHARTANPIPLSYNQNMQQHGQQRVDQSQYNTANGYGDQQPLSLEDWEAFMAPSNAGTLDQFSDFTLYEDPLAVWLGQPTPFVERAGLVVNMSSNTNIDPTKLLKSPVESIDTSSVTSSTRRSKREIMSGTSGEYKCRACGAGFNTPDDQRHHVYRVHLPYSSRPFPCSNCEKRFVYNKDRARHDRERHGDRANNVKYWCPFQGCEYATKGFVRKDHYNRHYATHFKADSAVQMSRSTSAQTFSQR